MCKEMKFFHFRVICPLTHSIYPLPLPSEDRSFSDINRYFGGALFILRLPLRGFLDPLTPPLHLKMFLGIYHQVMFSLLYQYFKSCSFGGRVEAAPLMLLLEIAQLPVFRCNAWSSPTFSEEPYFNFRACVLLARARFSGFTF